MSKFTEKLTDKIWKAVLRLPYSPFLEKRVVIYCTNRYKKKIEREIREEKSLFLDSVGGMDFDYIIDGVKVSIVTHWSFIFPKYDVGYVNDNTSHSSE